MKTHDFRPIEIDDVPAMVDLLIHRQNLESKAFPSLENNCLNAKHITDLLNKLLLTSKVIGMGAFVNDELVGYSIGKIQIDTDRGRHIWVPYEGVAIRKDQSLELIRNLYAEVSTLWLEQGCFNHYILIPFGNAVYYEAFLQLSFFIQQAHGIMSIEDYKPFENVSDADVRLANKMDSEAMGRMSSIIYSHQNLAPVFEPVLPEVVMKIKDGYKKIVEDDDSMIFIAEQDGQELGFQVYEHISSGLMVPDDGVELSIAGIYPSQMRSGVGKKLMNEGIRFIKEKGYKNIIIDWRITNLTSSTFWPKCGFRPVSYRMVRYIDSNFMWANFNNPGINRSKALYPD